jgi:polar amino acid transport system substrate-binding protein
VSAICSDVIRELAPTGCVRSTINLGNTVLAQQDPGTGALAGVSVDLARELASRLGIEAELHPFDTAGKAFAALASCTCDIGFLAIDARRANDLDYTAPYVMIEGTYLVPRASPLHDVDEFDQDGVRIAAGKNTAYELHLSRALRHATLVHYPSSAAAIDAVLAGETDAAAGVRQPLMAAASRNNGFRVIDRSFLSIQQAMALPQGRPAAHAFAKAFIEEMKASGFVASALTRSGQGDATVAGPEHPSN